jgi:hypothetical protein
MDDHVSIDLDWVTSRIDGAPEALRSRVEEWISRCSDSAVPDRLASAGALALSAADKPGAARESALDLLAADALITLALLHHAEHEPAGLESAARQLRVRAVEAA